MDYIANFQTIQGSKNVYIQESYALFKGKRGSSGFFSYLEGDYLLLYYCNIVRGFFVIIELVVLKFWSWTWFEGFCCWIELK